MAVTLFPECVAVPFEVLTELILSPAGTLSSTVTFSAVTALDSFVTFFTAIV